MLPKGKLSEDYQEELDRKLRQVHKNDIITVVYFCQNEYIKLTGMVSRIDETARVLKIVNTKISFDDLYDITDDFRGVGEDTVILEKSGERRIGR